MKLFVLPLFCCFSLSTQAKDTLEVKRVGVTTPITLTADTPYQTDSVDNKGCKFSATILNDHATRAFAQQEVSAYLESGTSLNSVDSSQTLRVLQFSVRSDRYTKATLDIKNLKNSKIAGKSPSRSIFTNVQIEPSRSLRSLDATQKEK